jgi:hypothetical protein
MAATGKHGQARSAKSKCPRFQGNPGCYERRENVIDAYFDLADAIITTRSLIRQAWTTHRWDTRPARRP